MLRGGLGDRADRGDLGDPARRAVWRFRVVWCCSWGRRLYITLGAISHMGNDCSVDIRLLLAVLQRECEQMEAELLLLPPTPRHPHPRTHRLVPGAGLTARAGEWEVAWFAAGLPIAAPLGGTVRQGKGGEEGHMSGVQCACAAEDGATHPPP